MFELGKILLLLGGVLILLGGFFLFFPNLPLGRLPGDIVFKRRGVSIYIPLVSCLLISIILSAIFYFWRK